MSQWTSTFSHTFHSPCGCAAYFPVVFILFVWPIRNRLPLYLDTLLLEHSSELESYCMHHDKPANCISQLVSPGVVFNTTVNISSIQQTPMNTCSFFQIQRLIPVELSSLSLIFSRWVIQQCTNVSSPDNSVSFCDGFF